MRSATVLPARSARPRLVDLGSSLVGFLALRRRSVGCGLATAALVAVSGAPPARAQSSFTLDATSGSNTISTSYSTTGGLTLNLGFFADYLVVGGGGGGGAFDAGGGGGGAVVTSLGGTSAMLASSSYAITVGSGGATPPLTGGRGGTGGTSSISGSGLNASALGGGGGGGGTQAPSTGSSGGGGSGWNGNLFAGAAGTAGQGFAGGAGVGEKSGGGGGGAGGSGQSGSDPGPDGRGGDGGPGLANTITGGSVTYGGGGGGYGTTKGQGGAGGGGASGAAGTNGLGGGGGGWDGGTLGAGGSGLVIIRYQGAPAGSGGSVTSGTGTSTGSTVHTFSTPGAGTLDLSSLNLNTRLGASLTGTISGSGDLIYAGPGRLTLTATNTYSGNTTISAGTLEVTGVLGGGAYAGAIANSGILAFNSASSQTISGGISGVGSLTKSGAGNLILSGTNSYTGQTTVSGGRLSVNGSLGNTAVTVASGAALGGSGTIGGTIGGAGTVNPGNSPGILTATQVDPSGGLDFTFEFSGTAPNYASGTSSVNDVLRLTGTTPFGAGLTSVNTKTLFLNFTKEQLTVGTGSVSILQGGFFTDADADFLSLINNATWDNAGFAVYVLGDGQGTDNSLNGVGYYNWRNPAMFGWTQSLFASTEVVTANFADATETGRVLTLAVAVPEPSGFVLAGIGTSLVGFLALRRRRRRSAVR